MRNKKLLILMLVVIVTMALMTLFVRQPLAFDFNLFGEPVTILGYTQQTVSYGLADNKYDMKRNFNSALFQGLLEVGYSPHPDWKFFGSAKLNADWTYPILRNNKEWDDKGFNHSREELYILDDGRDLLSELHVTWAPKDFYFRVGKQIVTWGETDGFRLMDQINPVDQRRGLMDLQFEKTIIPLWLVRAEYSLPIERSWLQSLGFQFIFNPNLEFRGNEAIVPGNDVMGVWAPKAETPLGGPYPYDYAHIGSYNEVIHKYNDYKGLEFGFRIRSVIYDTTMTLNYFYGRDNDPVRRSLPFPPQREVSPFDGRLIIHPAVERFYSRFRFVGGTLARDLDWLKASFLGGVSPVLRFEAFYAFDYTCATTRNTFNESDEFRWAVGMDWKVKIPFLNAKSYFTISPQLYQRIILDYPNNYRLLNPSNQDLHMSNWMSTLMINTTYFHNKLQPMVFWMRDISNHSDVVKLQVSWEQSNHWKYTLGALVIDGRREKLGFWALENKDQIYFTVSYKF